MSEWRDVALGDLVEVKHGFAFKGQFFADEGEYVLLTPGNFLATGGLRLGPSDVRFYSGPIPPAFVLSPGDLLVVMTDLKQEAPILGALTFVPEGVSLLHNQRLGLVQLLDHDVDPTFLYHFMCSAPYRQAVKASATGSTVRHTAPDRIRAINLRLPHPDTQRRIANILSTFGDLIGNNRRRIEILEEVARTLYREWFVRYRFPNYELIELIDSGRGQIPTGWTMTKLSELLSLRYGKALKANARRGGNVPVVGSSGIVGWHDEPMVDQPGVVIGRKGNVGSVIWTERPFFPIDTTYFVVSEIPMQWVRYLLESVTFQNSHAAVPGLNREDALRAEVVLPPYELIDRFSEEVSPLLELAGELRATMASLSAAVNLLLPKLVTGQIEVDSLGVDDVFGWAELAEASADDGVSTRNLR